MPATFYPLIHRYFTIGTLEKHVCRTSKKIADQHLRESTPTQTHASYFLSINRPAQLSKFYQNEHRFLPLFFVGPLSLSLPNR